MTEWAVEPSGFSTRPGSAEVSLTTMDIKRVLELLPHRYPFLLVDRVVECDPGQRLLAVKNVTVNEPHFTGHFPVKPVMPGVLIIEALAQATGLLAMQSAPIEEQAIYYLVGIDKARFKQPVEPGDQLFLEVQVLKHKRDIWVFTGKATVDGKMVASAEIMCTARDL
jgi:3-hydroxyacyl-[acyl-carrier-protein] dehydratase